MSSNKSVTAKFRDAQAPSVSLNFPTSGIFNGTIGPSASASDNSGVNRVEFRVRGALIGTDTSAPYGVSFNTASVPDGAALFQATAIDSAGNSTVASRTVTIDNTAPLATITSGPNGEVFAGGTTQTWNFSPFDATSGIQSVRCAVDTGSLPSTAPCSGGNTSHSVSGLADGDYTFFLFVRDNGNLTTLATRTFTIDGTAPTLGISSGPDGEAFTEGATQSWSFSASDSHLQSVQCSVGGTGSTPSYGACSGGNSSHSVSGLAPGTYIFRVRALDTAGNETLLTRSFSVTPAADPGGGGNTGGTGGNDPGAGGNTGGTGGSTGGTGGTGGTGPGVTDAQITSLLAADLATAARTLSRQRLAKLARKGSLGLRFSALMAGRFALAFKGAATKQKAARSIVIAKGSRSVTASGAYTVTLKLTKAGRRLLKGGRRVKGRLSASFTKAGGGTLYRLHGGRAQATLRPTLPPG
jgi:hypothetical protein